MIPVSPRHSLYVERSGKQGGYPIFFLHGGPGSHSRAVHRRYFDPDFFDIVLFDQRGCGKSVPAGETRDNDTDALVADIDTIRQALGIQCKISLLGGSWGSTLALACALRYPQWIDELILRGVFLGTHEEVAWFTSGLARFAPDAWQQFAGAAGGANLVDYYYDAVFAADNEHALEAATRWAAYEMQIMRTGSPSLPPTPATGLSAEAPLSPLQSAQATLHSARVQLHFLKHQCFLAGNPLLEAAQHIQLPVTIVQGELDLVCPPVTAWQLARCLPQATLRLVSSAGHSALAGSLALALKEEVDALRDRLRDRAAGGAE